MLPPALVDLFEDQLQFQTKTGAPLEGSVWIGESEFLPLEVLRTDRTTYVAEFNRWLEEDWRSEMQDSRLQIVTHHASQQRFIELTDRVRGGSVRPFVGSGMSVPSRFPTWSTLLRTIGESIGIPTARMGELLQAGRFEEAADLLAATANRRLLAERIEGELGRPLDSSAVGPIRLLPVIFPSLVLTTNLDGVLESCYDDGQQGELVTLAGAEISRFRSLKRDDRRFILKLHGDCHRRETQVLLTGEYDRAYARGSVPREELELLVRSNSILFIGCSLSFDRTVGQVEEISRIDENMPRHYAFLKDPGERQRLATEHGLTGIGIFPIWYKGGHDEAVSSLLAGLVPPGPYGDSEPERGSA
jgi:hypothetical protein